jgi:hypothetical protein
VSVNWKEEKSSEGELKKEKGSTTKIKEEKELEA